MKKIVVVLVFLTSFLKLSAQIIETSNEGKRISEVLRTFIDSYKNRGVDYDKYCVYVIFVHKPLDVESSDTCFTIEAIENESFYKLVKPQYYCFFDNEIILFRFDHSIKYYEEPDLKPLLMNNEAKEKAISKLLPSKKGYITGTSLGYLIYKNGLRLRLNVYKNSDYIPKLNKAILFPDFNEAELIRGEKAYPMDELKR